MQEAFEKNIEEQLKSFTISPNESVWQEVELALHPNKRRIISFWWLWLFAFLVVGIGISSWYYYNNVKIIDTQAFHTTKIDIKNTTTPLKEIQKNEILNPISIKSNLKNSSTTQLDNKEIETIKVIKKASKIYSKNKTSFLNITTKKNEIIHQSMDTIQTKELDYFNETALPVPRAILATIPLVALENTEQEKNSKVIDSNIASTSLATSTISLAKSKTTLWFWNASVGIVQSQKKLFNSEKSIAFASSITQNPTTTINNTAIIQSGLSLAGGIGFSKEINRRWGYSASIQYNFLHTAQQLSYDTAAFNASTFATSYINPYSGSVSNKVNSTVHWLKLPIMLQYNLAPNKANQWMLNVGTSIAYTLYSNWLITDDATAKYYFNRKYNNHFFINVYAGFSFKHKQQYSISLLAERSFTPIHQQVASNRYLSQINLQFSKFLKIKK